MTQQIMIYIMDWRRDNNDQNIYGRVQQTLKNSVLEIPIF